MSILPSRLGHLLTTTLLLFPSCTFSFSRQQFPRAKGFVRHDVQHFHSQTPLLPTAATGSCTAAGHRHGALSMIRRPQRQPARRRFSTDTSDKRNRRPRAPPPPLPPPGHPTSNRFREAVVVGGEVWVVKKGDQRTGKETRGIVGRHLTKSPYHPRGIKVMLEGGVVGRVTRVLSADDDDGGED